MGTKGDDVSLLVRPSFPQRGERKERRDGVPPREDHAVGLEARPPGSLLSAEPPAPAGAAVTVTGISGYASLRQEVAERKGRTRPPPLPAGSLSCPALGVPSPQHRGEGRVPCRWQGRRSGPVSLLGPCSSRLAGPGCPPAQRPASPGGRHQLPEV